MLKQKCVYWHPAGKNEYSDLVWDAPIELKCRWEEGADEVLTIEGREINPDHLVYVESDVVVGGLLLFGSLSDLVGNTPPESAKRIVKFTKLPTLKAKKFLRTAYL